MILLPLKNLTHTVRHLSALLFQDLPIQAKESQKIIFTEDTFL